MLNIAGKVRNDPPPATAFNAPPRKAATISQGKRQSVLPTVALQVVRESMLRKECIFIDLNGSTS